MMSHKTVIMALTMLLLVATDARAETISVQKKGATASESTQRVDIKTLSGLTYTKCRITKTEPDGITIYHSKGVAKIPFTTLSQEYRKRYNYDPTNAMAYAQAAAEQNVAAWDRIEQRQRDAPVRGDSMAGKRAVKAFGTGDFARTLAEKQAKAENDRDGKDYNYYASTDENGTWILFADPRKTKASSVRGSSSTYLGNQNPWGESGTKVIGSFSTYAEAFQRKQAMEKTYVGGTLETYDEMVIDSGNASMSVQCPPKYSIDASPDKTKWLLKETRF